MVEGTLGGQGHTDAWSRDHSVQCVVNRHTVPCTLVQYTVDSALCSSYVACNVDNVGSVHWRGGQGHTNAGPGDRSLFIHSPTPVTTTVQRILQTFSAKHISSTQRVEWMCTHFILYLRICICICVALRICLPQ